MTSLDRRHLLRGLLYGGLAVASGGLAAACSSNAPNTPTISPVPSTGSQPVPSSRVLIAYFSRAGENYYNGGRRNLTVGNTEVVANMIRARLGCDVYRIEASDAYSDDYEATVERNVQEERSNARPAIANPLPDLAGFDTLIVGNPIWNSQAPMIMQTFFEGLDLSGKTIYPFVTYAVSGLSGVDRDYAGLEPDATVGTALAIRGEEASDADGRVARWLEQIGLARS